MSEQLLKNVRVFREMVKRAGENPLNFREIVEKCGEMTDSDILLVSKKGKALQVYRDPARQSGLAPEWEQGVTLDEEKAAVLGGYVKTATNADLRICGVGSEENAGNNLLLPLETEKGRLGTLILCRSDRSYAEDELILAEMAALLLTKELALAIYEEDIREKKNNEIVRAAISTLSFSELAAIIHIFNELDGEEGLLIASKIADRVGITRSVIVNALRKFESAGVIESRSLGMKGTYIRILNPVLRDELAKYKRGFQ